MSNFKRERINPLELMKKWDWDTPHIEFEPFFKGNLSINRQVSHDGTFVFYQEILQDTLIRLANKETYKKNDYTKNKAIVDIKYTIGWLYLFTVYGQVKIAGGTYPGMKQRTRLSVKCEYIYEGE